MSGGEVVEAGELKWLNLVSRAAADPNTDVDKLERLIALQKSMMAREAETAFHRAMASMQPELPEIAEHGEIKNKQGDRQSTYAKWEDQQAAIKPVLAKHGFSLTFRIAPQDGNTMILVYGRLAHIGGHVEESPSPPLPADTSGSKNAVQAYGSSVSYGMRYAAKALLNLTSRGEDDDGVAGGTRLIEPGELEVLEGLAREAHIKDEDFGKLALRLGVPSLDMLPKAKLAEAERILRDRKARAEARASQPPP